METCYYICGYVTIGTVYTVHKRIPYVCTEAVSNGNKTNITHTSTYLMGYFQIRFQLVDNRILLLFSYALLKNMKIMHAQQADCNTP